MAKMIQNQLKEAIDDVKTQRLELQLQIEQVGLRQDFVKLERAEAKLQIEQMGLQNDNIKIQQAEITNALDTVKLGSMQDKLGFDEASRVLQQQEYAAQLQLKTINIENLFEDVRHERVMLYGGGGSSVYLP